MRITSPGIPLSRPLPQRPKLEKLQQELGANTDLLPAILEPEAAMDLQAPTLRRPVLLVHGLAQQADTWVNMKNYLCSNPANHYGGVYRAGHYQEFLDSNRMNREFPRQVFAINFNDNLSSPKSNAHELREALVAIQALTGSDRVDVVTHSMGALQAREALRQGETAMGDLIMLSPPNQGAYGANLMTGLNAVGYNHYPEGKGEAFQALRLETGPLGGVANEYLHGLNQSWEKDRERLDSATVITGVGVPTVDRSWSGVADGDGLVAANRAGLPNTPMYLAGDNGTKPAEPHFRDCQALRYNHFQIVSEVEVFQKVGEILATPETSSQLTLF